MLFRSSAVGTLVCAQIAAVTEGLVALTTYEWLGSAVGTLVCAQITASIERLVALTTHEWLRSAVGTLMCAQITAFDFCAIALATHVPIGLDTNLFCSTRRHTLLLGAVTQMFHNSPRGLQTFFGRS